MQGVHFFFHAAVAGAGGRQTAPRTGTFLELKRRQVVVRRWNATSEDLDPADDVQAALSENRHGERGFVHLWQSGPALCAPLLSQMSFMTLCACCAHAPHGTHRVTFLSRTHCKVCWSSTPFLERIPLTMGCGDGYLLRPRSTALSLLSELPWHFEIIARVAI